MREIFFESKHYSALVFENEGDLARYAARIVVEQMKNKPEFLLGLATGSSPIPFYKELIREYQAGNISFAKVNTYNLDEYYPIDPTSPQSFLVFMRENLFDHIDLPEKAIHIPRGDAPDAEEEARRYQRELNRTGGTDIQILGIGSDGHIGFNEPGDAFIYDTHVTELTRRTIEDNSRFFEDVSQVPTHALTMGIGGIMNARTCILIATGKNKAQAVHDALKCDPAPACQASVLQFHRNTVFLLDEGAASLL